MTKQLDDMWSSKWLLPEHNEARVEDDRNQKRKPKPELDEQELDNMSKALVKSLISKCLVTIVLYRVFENREITCTVVRRDQQLQQVKISLFNPDVEAEEEQEWIKLDDILKAETIDFEELGWE